MKKFLLSALMFLGVVSASAQEQKGTTEYVFEPHWYVMVQPLGAQYTLGEASFEDLVSYNAQIAGGYNFNSIVGARLAVNAWKSKAGIELQNLPFNASWSWKYVAPSVDLTVNLSNWACGFNPNRLFNLTAFAGLGANIAFDNDEACNVDSRLTTALNTKYPPSVAGAAPLFQDQNLAYLWCGTKTRLFAQVGLIGDFRLTDQVSVNLELNANTINDHYNSKRAGNADWYFNALAGVKINLGKTYSTRFVPEPEPEIRIIEQPAPQPVQPLVEENQPTASSNFVEEVEPLRRDIFFHINKTNIRDDQMQKVQEIAEYLEKYPAAKVVMTGYADKGTGNKSINARLAAKRSEVVANTLKTKYHISADRITYISKGDTEQPYPDDKNIKDNMNRVTICIAQ